MTNTILITGILAIVLLAGYATPIFAQEFQQLSISEPLQLPPVDEENEIFDNGRGDSDIGGPEIDLVNQFADDFVLENDAILQDIHFDGIIILEEDIEPPVLEFEWVIYLDNDGVPGEIVANGEGLNEGQMLIEEIFIEDIGEFVFLFRFWFDLDEPLVLEAGQTYWLQILSPASQETNVIWLAKEHEFGNELAVKFSAQPWETCCPFDFNFVLTGGDKIVGGELIPIDATTLFVAGIQSRAVWVIPTILVLSGTGFYLLKFRTNKE